MYDKYYSGFDALTSEEYDELMLEMELNNLEDELKALKAESDKLVTKYNELFVNDELDNWVKQQPKTYWSTGD